MSAAFFEDTFLMAGQARIQDAELIAAVLQMANLVVTADEVQKHLATWDRSGDYVLLSVLIWEFCLQSFHQLRRGWDLHPQPLTELSRRQSTQR